MPSDPDRPRTTSDATPASLPPGLGPWPLRLAWLALPFTVGSSIGEALAPHSAAVRLTAAGLGWALWFVALVATYVAHPLGLTVLRLIGPAALVGGTAACIVGQPVAWVAASTVMLGAAATTLALHPATADRCVDGASYGPEQRVALAVPLPLLLGPLALTWAVAAAGLITGPLLLAARLWVFGTIATALGIGLVFAAVRSVHGLSNRFIVLVPAGFVLHDRAALLEPVLLSRDTLEAIGPAHAGTSALDLTRGAIGLVVQATLSAPLAVPVRTGRRTSTMTTCEAVLFCPWRPGRFLAAAAAHGLPVR